SGYQYLEATESLSFTFSSSFVVRCDTEVDGRPADRVKNVTGRTFSKAHNASR
ncbi:unnamed protein product, partial [Amoebophrya sp. A25]